MVRTDHDPQEHKTVKQTDLEHTCVDCNAGFPAAHGATEWAICLYDPEFGPYLELILGQQDYSQCHDLVSRNRFLWDRPACERFEPVERTSEIELTTTGAEELSRLADDGELNVPALEQVLLRDQLRKIDWSTVSVDPYVDSLHQSRSLRDRQEAIRLLGGLIAQRNDAALDFLCDYMDRLLPPATIEETHLRIALAEQLGNAHAHGHRRRAAERLATDLRRIPSNNTTRGYYTAVFRFFERSSVSLVEEFLCPMLESGSLSHRLKRRIQEVRSSRRYR